MNLRNHHGQMSESLLTASFIILSGGLQDAYTYLCRGKVFANAQTGNIVLCSAYLFDGQWRHSARYLIPVLSFLLGIFAAECIHRHFKYTEKVHWRQMIILAEIALLFAVETFRIARKTALCLTRAVFCRENRQCRIWFGQFDNVEKTAPAHKCRSSFVYRKNPNRRVFCYAKA